VAGRHRDTAEGDAPQRFSVVLPALGAAFVLLVGVGGWAVVSATSGCEGRVPIDVVAAPDIAPVVADVAERVTGSEQRIDGRCLEVRVSAQPSADMAAVLAGTRVGSGPPPEVWIPDSSVWVEQVRIVPAKAALLPTEYASLASSPTVIAAPAPVAKRLAAGGSAGADGSGGPGGLGWRTLLQQFNSGQPLNVGFPNPSRNTTGLAALLSVAQVTGTSPQARTQQAAVARTLSRGAADDVSELFGKLPRTADAAAVASGVAALPATEQSVWKYNQDSPAVPLTAVYPSEGALRLDYPYVPLRDATDPRRTRAAAEFLAELRSADSRRAFQDNGFRGADGQAGGALSKAVGVDSRPPKNTGTPSPQAVTTVLRSWQALSAASRMLVLIDVSGSMQTKVPGTGISRLATVVTAAQQGLGLVGDTTEIGLWTFSSRLEGDRDYRLLVPPGPLSRPVGDVPDRRTALANELTKLQPVKDGSTGLYDSILAVYRVAVAGYQPDKVNSVLVYTDGKNSDPAGGISLDTLLAELRKGADPRRPVPVFMLAFGPDVDMDSARKIAAATNGGAFNVNSPGEITSVFIQAVGQRTCRPNC
jgi:hypothetical protein